MTIGETMLVLAPGLLLTPLSLLPADVRRRIDPGLGQVALTVPNTRTTTQLIDADAARLLERFRSPNTVSQALREFCDMEGLDPTTVSAEALAFLAQMQAGGVLHAADRPAPPSAFLAPGCIVGEYEVLACVWQMDDTEVYQVRDGSGGLYALKVCREGANDDALVREAEILKHLMRFPSVAAPELKDEGHYRGRRFCCTRWCTGEPVADVAESWRAEGDRLSSRLLDLCYAVSGTYRQLHRAGVVHGDVRSRNILVDHDREIRLLDFGLARFDPQLPGAKQPGRGGFGFYLEPECARACLDGKAPPPATKLSDQYSVAALLYLLLAGKPYIDFRLETQAALYQIVDDAPLPFARAGIPPAPAVEAVLRRALSKDPDRRFASMDDLAEELGEAAAAAAAPKQHSGPRRSAAVSQTAATTHLDETLARLEQALQPDPGEAPRSSVAYGAAGIAYLFYRAACLRADSRLLSIASAWALRAAQSLPGERSNRVPALDPERSMPSSLYYGEPGVHVVRALVSQAAGHAGSVQAGLQAFLSSAHRSPAGCDLSGGSAGLLLGCSLLFEAISPGRLANTVPIEALAGEIVRQLYALHRRVDDIRALSEVRHLGMAHGWAGTLYAILRWFRVTGEAPAAIVEERLDQLASLAFPSGRGLFWRPTLVPDDPPWPGWCHGSAGYVHLWSAAWQIYGDGRYLELAERAARHSAEHPNLGIPHLCCGLAGQAEALLTLYGMTGREQWREQAQALADLTPTGDPVRHETRDSLYKGSLGTALLALDLEYPSTACMPLFGAEGWF